MNTNINQILTDCDREKIQYIEAIQPFGSLLVTDAERVIIAHAIPANFLVHKNAKIGARLDSILGDDASRISDALEKRSEPTTPLLLKNRTSGGWMTCIAHASDDNKIFEFEQSPSRDVNIPSVKFMNERHKSLDTYLAFIAENIQMVTGFDRVMIYKFAPDWHGEVVAESLVANSYSFFGHHFPATDIPLPARELFSKVWARAITDVNALPVQLAINSGTKIDLSKSVLRASSPVHLEYLQNMGVASTLTLSIMCDGKLWGLIACHHFSPKHLVAEERSVYALLAKLISSRVSVLLTNESIDAGRRVIEFGSELERLLNAEKLVECVRDQKREFLKSIECDGFSFIDGETVISDGHAPPASESKRFAQQLNNSGVDIVNTDSVSPVFAPTQAYSFAGALGFRAGSSWFIWSRKEVVRSILWAGDPHKPAYADDKAHRLSPRLSFESWRENVSGMSAPWRQFEIDSAQKLGQSILRSIGLDEKQKERKAELFQQELKSQIKQEVESLTSTFKALKLDDLPPVT